MQIPYKRNYHPLVILFYAYDLLDHEQLAQIPKNTRNNWNKFKHDYYDCEAWVKPFLLNFEELQTVYKRNHLRKTMLLIITISNGYHNVLKSITKKKTLLRDHAESIVSSIEILVKVSNIKVARACIFYGVSKDWFYREKRKVKCSLTTFRLCYRQHPNQLTQEEVLAIEQILFAPEHYGKTKTTLYYHGLVNGLVFCSKSTFCKYATALGYQRAKHKKKIIKVGFRATHVFEWLHVDITYVPTLDEGMQKVAFVKDNFSKAILHFKSTNEKAGSQFITALFQETFNKHDLFNTKVAINILSDGGSENKGQLLSWVKHIKAPPVVTKITARTAEFPFSNSMAESTHSIYKTEFMRKALSKNISHHLENLNNFVEYYNNERYFGELYGYTALQVVNGAIPDKHRFKAEIKQARKHRVIKNQNFNNCSLLLKSNLSC